MVNKQGQTRIAQYFVHQELEERIAMEGEIIRKCLSRSETQVRPTSLYAVANVQASFMEYQNYKIVYRRYASLFFIVGVDLNENELGILEFIHSLVETFDTYFKNVVRSLSLSPATSEE